MHIDIKMLGNKCQGIKKLQYWAILFIAFSFILTILYQFGLIDIGRRILSFYSSSFTEDSEDVALLPYDSFTKEIIKWKKNVLEVGVNCTERIRKCSFRLGHGHFFVASNYIQSIREFKCNETITYTTHADYMYLGNLKPLLERWHAPVSLAIYAPGTDFQLSLYAIRYAQDCLSPLVRQFVTFHVYFEIKFLPEIVPNPGTVMKMSVNCSEPAPWHNISVNDTFRKKQGILYPVNVGRNIAREMATTYYVLASDIELYPNPGIIPAFLDMIRVMDPGDLPPNRVVFPLPVFEVEEGKTLPENKEDLMRMIGNKSAVIFHRYVCPQCHEIPGLRSWFRTEESQKLRVFYVAKRDRRFKFWEPIFIGTNNDPPYDERLSWEGMSDKMSQAFVLCLADYRFSILNNAFLVHKPGIKKESIKSASRRKMARLVHKNLQVEWRPRISTIFGKAGNCFL